MLYLWGTNFEKLTYPTESEDYIFRSWKEMFEGNFADTCTKQFLLMLIGGASDHFKPAQTQTDITAD